MNGISPMTNKITQCPECGSTDLTWHSSVDSNSRSVDGRLSYNDVYPLFFLRCEEHSHTLKLITGDELALEMTDALKPVSMEGANA